MCLTISEGCVSQLLLLRWEGESRMVLELGRKEREWEWLAVGLKGALPWRLVYFLFRKFIAVIV